MVNRRSLIAGIAGASLLAGSGNARVPSMLRVRNQTFDLYDSLMFIGKPDLSSHGFKRSRTVYESELWPPSADRMTPHEAAVRSRARTLQAEGITASVPVILDVEQYSTDIRLNLAHANPDTSIVDDNIRKLERIIGWFKREAPMFEVGFYGIVPVDLGLPRTDQHPANETEIATWEMANSYLLQFANHVDAIYPSLYTSTAERANWVAAARRYISEAKRIGAGKPVRPFVWPQYHDVMRGPLRLTYIEYDYWLLQLTTIREAGASGIVFWGGYKTEWDDTQDWWRATLDFIDTM